MKKNIKNTDNNAIRLLRILREVILIILALAIPLVICLIVFSVNGFYPFDKSGNTILMIDAQSQYISYLRNYREILLSGDSLIYTTSKLFGGDFLSIFSYYLSSPFNLLLVFFPSTEIPAFILYSSIAKICLSSLNMYLLFRFTNKHQADIGQLAFAVSYGLISYSFVYMSNFMWLDGVMILPLVILGLEKAFEKKAYWIYPLALAYALITSWYIGAMICIFVTLFTLTNIFLSKELTKKWYLTLGKFALLSLVGGLIAGAIWVPAFTHFSGTKVTSAFSKLEWFSPAYFFSGLMENSYTTHSLICQNEGYYTMFTSTPALVFFIASFFNSNLKKRERIAYLLLILVYFIGTISTITNDILHFGRAPAWFPGRYTFIIGFLVCFLAEKERSNLVGQKPLGLLFTIIVILGIIFILSEYNSLNGDFTYTYTTSEIIAFAVALFLVTLFYLLPRKLFTAKLPASGAKTISFLTSLAVIVISSYSAFSGVSNIISHNNSENQYQTQAEYLVDDALQAGVDKLKNYDESDNYRMELTFNRPGCYNQINNNPMFYSYSGLSHYSSSEKKDVQNFMNYIGFQYNGFFEGYDGGSTSAINSFLGIKYLIDDPTTYSSNKTSIFQNEPFQEMTAVSDETLKYYQNSAALPLGFRVEKANNYYISEGQYVTSEKIHWYDHFEYQNEIFKESTKQVTYVDSEDGKTKQKDIFHPLTVTSIENKGFTVVTDPDTLESRFTGVSGSTYTIHFTVPEGHEDDSLYYGLKDWNTSVSSTLDGRSMQNNTYWHKGIRSFSHKSNNQHTLILRAVKDLNNERLIPELYYEDEDILKEYTDSIASQGCQDLKVIKGLDYYGYEGSFNLTSSGDDSSFLFTLPYEENMHIYIDGKEYDSTNKFRIFTSCQLQGLALGNHTISLVYKDKGFDYGLIASALGIISLGAVLFYHTHNKNYLSAKRKEDLISGLL